ncbi:acetate permease [Burkholderia pseudomallei]|uniref:acetate permease n=1 Tax=Burkholderia pseudomallei TaxID=28450 RepID=UPI003140887D
MRRSAEAPKRRSAEAPKRRSAEAPKRRSAEALKYRTKHAPHAPIARTRPREPDPRRATISR